MINIPGFAFYSLYDGKQPFLMWVFGITNKIIPDPLLAGRLVSVALGGLGVLGIYLLSALFLPWPFLLIAPLIYIIVPIFVFFDRQALMESAVCSVNIWSFYLLSLYFKRRSLVISFFIGSILGIGLFIKSNTFIFFLLTVVSLGFFLLKERKIKEKQNYFWALALILFFTFFFILPLIIQPDFLNIIKMSNRFNLTIKELLFFPFDKWWGNISAFLKISFWQLTPAVFLLIILGLIKAIKERYYLFLFWFFGSLAITILTARNLNPRYIMPLLPLTSILAALAVAFLFIKQKFLGFFGLFALFFPLYVTFLLIFKPLAYFSLLNNFIPAFSQKKEYVTGNTAGYGLDKVRQFLEEKAEKQPIVLGVRLDAGNPENALFAYYFENPRIKVVYLDKQLLKGKIEEFSFKKPVYFVSRSEHKGGLEDCLIEKARFYKPEKESYFGVYRFTPE